MGLLPFRLLGSVRILMRNGRAERGSCVLGSLIKERAEKCTREGGRHGWDEAERRSTCVYEQEQAVLVLFLGQGFVLLRGGILLHGDFQFYLRVSLRAWNRPVGMLTHVLSHKTRNKHKAAHLVNPTLLFSDSHH